jgi:hypothetical protein
MKAQVVIFIIFIVASLTCCKEKMIENRAAPKTMTGVLDSSVITEARLDQKFVTGMRREEVESRIGKAYRYIESDDRVEARYYITRSLTNTPEMIGFTVHYKNGKIDHVDKSWLALGN